MSSIGFGSGGGYGWCPLGWGEPYYPWYHSSRGYFRNVNVTNTRIVNITNITNNYYNNPPNRFGHQNTTILLSITGGRDLSLWEVNEAAKAVAEAAHPDANIIFGAMVDEKLQDEVWITVVATGYGTATASARRRERRPAAVVPEVADAEPRVTRSPRREAASLDELNVPEFLPRS